MTERWAISDDDDVRRLLDDAVGDVHRYACRLAGTDRQLAEDLVQDACERLIRSARSASVEEVGLGWFHTVIRNRFIDHLRATRRLDVGLPDAEHGTEQTEGSGEWLVDRLAPIERFVLVAHHVDGFGVVDVARMIGKSAHATESLLVTARAHARRIGASRSNRD